MNNQHETTNRKSGNISELEMVGTLLFGSISDTSSDMNAGSETGAEIRNETGTESEGVHSESAAVSNLAEKSVGASSRMINLGARIAPENERRWEEETRESSVISSTYPAETVSVSASPAVSRVQNVPSTTASVSAEESVPETASIQNTPAAAHPFSGNRQKHAVPFVYRVCFTVLAVCAALFAWQTYTTEKPASNVKTTSVADTDASKASSVSASAAAPVVEPISDTAFSAPEAVPTFDATTPTNSFAYENGTVPTVASVVNSMPAEEEIPQFNPNIGCDLTPAPTASAIGSPVVMTPAEVYPTYNPALSDPNAAVQTAVQNTAQNMTSAAVYASNPVSVSAQPANTTAWNAGASMEEMPVFNAEISNFNAAAPQTAPLAPQVGAQAQQVQPQQPVQAPRKLARPAASHHEVSAASVQVPEEAYPTFNPGVGVDNSLPVSYY